MWLWGFHSISFRVNWKSETALQTVKGKASCRSSSWSNQNTSRWDDKICVCHVSCLFHNEITPSVPIYPNLCVAVSFLICPKKNETFLYLEINFPFTLNEMIYSPYNILRQVLDHKFQKSFFLILQLCRSQWFDKYLLAAAAYSRVSTRESYELVTAYCWNIHIALASG